MVKNGATHTYHAGDGSISNRNIENNPANGGVNVLCNGNVLMTGNFHPSKLTYEMLMNMRKNLK